MVCAHTGAPVFSLVVRMLPSSRFQFSLSVRSGAPGVSLVVRLLPSSRYQSGSSEHSGSPVFSLDARTLPSSQSQSALSQVPVSESSLLPSAGGYCFAPERVGSLPLPFVFLYLCAD